MRKDIFIGGAWPYANYLLHIGHLAALLPGDVLARYYRGNGDNVIYVSGTDAHGTPITERAKKENTTAQKIAEYYHDEFVKTFDALNFSYDLYTTTSTDEHEKLVQEYFCTLLKNGYIYEKQEDQDFCEKCNTFLSDREIVGICPHCGGKCSGDQCDVCLDSLDANEVLDKHCKECGLATVLKKNKHLYFKLSAFQKDLEILIKDSGDMWRKHALSEAKKFLDMGLIDRAVTRQLDWGVRVPVDGYEDKRVYVWIEAVLGYLTAGKTNAEARGIDFDKFMSNDNKNLSTYYVHGKDNITFHTILFPALLKGLKNNYQLPKYIISSEYVNTNDEKMSKSKGNLITVNELVKMYDCDTIRYYMIANGPEKKDINFSDAELILNHNKFLVGVLGNFINRNLSFIVKKFDGVITKGIVDEEIKALTEKEYKAIGQLIEKGELKAAIERVMDYATIGNKYYDDKQPWIQVKEDMEAFNNTTYTCVYIMANLSNLIAPFIPNASLKIKNMLNLEAFKWEPINLDSDIKINDIGLLFDRIDTK